MGDASGGALGLAESGGARAAETLLRTNGARTVLLRLPVAAVPGDAGEQLGLAVPEFRDVELGPCVFRKAGSRRALLISADAVLREMGTLAFESAELLFEAAAGVDVDGVVYGVDSFEPMEARGAVVCFRVNLHAE